MTKAQTTREYIQKQVETLADYPECGTSSYNLAVGLIAEGKYDEAIKHLGAAIDSCPTLAEAHVALGGIYFHKGDLDACINMNMQAIKVRPKLAPAYGNVGFVHLQRGNPESAVSFLEKTQKNNLKDYWQAMESHKGSNALCCQSFWKKNRRGQLRA